MRVLAAAALAAVSITCAENSISGPRARRIVALAVAPAFDQAPQGGPSIDVRTVQGVLKRANSADSAVATGAVTGDSAILEFNNVTVTGDSTAYELGVKAFDKDNVLVFQGTQVVKVKPGDNAPAAPALHYSAPDTAVASIDINVASLALDWAGGAANDLTCINRVPSPTAKTSQKLTVSGKSASNQDVTTVRVGWTSRDTAVATVDSTGLVKARCSNKSTYVVARTFLNKVDSIAVNVTAPPFTLLMNPDSINLPRGDTAQLSAVVVDENNNPIASSGVTWRSSDSSRALVTADGRVIGRDNGRVLITATTTTNRLTIGVVQVVRPRALRVLMSPHDNTIAVGRLEVYSAEAFDRNDARIPDAAGFTWLSSNASVAQVNSSGNVKGFGAGTAFIYAKLDGKVDSGTVTVIATTLGDATGKVVNASTGAPVSGAVVTGPGNATATTDANGVFTITGLNAGADVTIAATSLVTVTYFNLPIQPGSTIQLGDIPMAPGGGTGTLTGRAVNSLNDAAVAGLQVRLFAGINPKAADPSTGVTTPAPVATTTSGADGTFTLSAVAAGTYTYAVGGPATGGATFAISRATTVSVPAQTKDSRVAVTPVLNAGAIRVVLSWGNCADPSVPCDLDSHLTGPGVAPDTGRFHVAYFNPSYLVPGSATDTVADLDNDATSGLGPETVTLRVHTAGVYKYYVHNYEDGSDTTSGRLSNSAQARVDVYQGSNLIATFFPPRGVVGTLWSVFQYDGSTITPVQQFIRLQDFSDIPADFIRAEGSTPVAARSTDPTLRRLVTDILGHRKAATTSWK